MEIGNILFRVLFLGIFFWLFSLGDFPIRGLISRDKEKILEVLFLYLLLLIQFVV